MKRTHRYWQRRIWWLVTPAAALVLVLALLWRSEVPDNSIWPGTLAQPAAAKGA